RPAPTTPLTRSPARQPSAPLPGSRMAVASLSGSGSLLHFGSTSKSAGRGSRPRPLPDPELAEQRAPERVVLVVADPFREKVAAPFGGRAAAVGCVERAPPCPSTKASA